MDAIGDSPPRERQVYEAKEAYFKLVKAGVKLSLRELANRSEELTGEKIAYETLRRVAGHEGWVGQARILLAEHNPEEYNRLVTMLDVVYARIKKAKEPKDLAPAARAYLGLLNIAMAGIIYLEEERILEVRDKIFHFIEDFGGTMPAIYLPRLTHTHGALRKRIEADLTIMEENGVNPDALLLGV